jgi:adenosylcobinamide-GDP ribazoletransferase
VAPTLGRWGMTIAIYAFPYARPDGLGRSMKDHTSLWQAILATLIALGVAWFAGGWWGLIALVIAACVLVTGAWFTLRRIPGMTGDIYGALNELIETAVLLTFVVGRL